MEVYGGMRFILSSLSTTRCSLPALSAVFSYSCALFCTLQKLNPFIFKLFHTVCRSHPRVVCGVGILLASDRSSQCLGASVAIPLSPATSHGSRVTRYSMTQPSRTISKNFCFPPRAPWILRMRQIGRDSPNKMQKHCGGVLVSGNRRTERHVAQILQRIRQSVIRGISRLPEPVALGEFFRCKRRQSQQIVRSVFDHVDAQVVSRVNAKVRSMRIPNREPVQLNHSIERRMLDSLDLRNVHQSPESLIIKDFAVRREHLSQLEGQHVRISPAHSLISRRLLRGRLSVQPASLEQNRNSSMRNNDVHLLSVERDDVTRLPFDVSARHKRRASTQGLSRPSQHVKLFRCAQIIDVAGVHIDGVHQSAAMRCQEMRLKRFDGYSPIRLKRKQ